MMPKITLAHEKVVHLVNCKPFFLDANGSYQRNMVFRRLVNKVNDNLEAKSIEVEIDRSDLTHFRNGILGGIRSGNLTDRETGHLMACAESLRITSWVEPLLPKLEEKDVCQLELDPEDGMALDASNEASEG